MSLFAREEMVARRWTGRARARGLRTLALVGLAALACLLLPGMAAAAAPTPPFTQCPPVGLDTSCGTLIVIEPGGKAVAYNDPSQPPYLTEDTLIGVQNNSEAAVTSIELSGPFIFGFDEDGLCTASPHPEGCPFGPTGYEGPGTSFTITNFEEGSVNFLEGGLAPTKSTYFSLEEPVALICEEGKCKAHKQEPTSVSTTLTGGEASGPSITVPQGTSVTDKATIGGVNAKEATGTATYSVYSDNECKTLVASAGTATVSGESVPASSSENLPAGTYYWQAAYSGDENNQASKSVCGAEVLTVTEPPPGCSTVRGEAVYVLGTERQRLTDNLSTNLARKPQVFHFSWLNGEEHVDLTKLTKASCVVTTTGGKKFIGEGLAELNNEPGYKVKFTIGVSNKGANTVVVHVLLGKEKVASFHDAAKTGQVIS